MRFTSKDLDIAGIPSLNVNAFRSDGFGINAVYSKGGGDAPAPPDYVAAAKATAQGDLDLAKYQTQANRINQYTPWGNVTYTNDRQFDQQAYDAAMAAYNRQVQQQQSAPSGWSYVRPNHGYGESDMGIGRLMPVSGGGLGGGLGGLMGSQSTPTMPDPKDFYTGGDNWEQHVQLAPELQAMLEQEWAIQQGLVDPQNAALARVQEMMAAGFDPSALPEGGTAFAPSGEILPTYDPNLQTNNATELLMGRINPQLDRQREALRAQLANQGIAQGSPAYNQAMLEFGQQANDAHNQAALQGIGLGMQQQGLQFSQGLANRQLTAAEQAQQFGQSEQARQRALTEAAYLRSLPMQELGMLMGGNQVQMPQFPGYAQQGQVAGPDLLGAAGAQHQGNIGKWNANQAQRQQSMQGWGGLGGAVGGLFGGPVGGAIGSIGGTLLGGLFG